MRRRENSKESFARGVGYGRTLLETEIEIRLATRGRQKFKVLSPNNNPKKAEKPYQPYQEQKWGMDDR